MRIALDCRYVTDHFPGIGRYAYELALNLPAMSPDDTFFFVVDPDGENTRYDLNALGDPANANVIEVAAGAMSFSQQWKVPDALARHQVELYHSPYYVMPLATTCKRVVTIHDLIPRFYPEALPKRWLAPMFMALLKAAVRSAHGVLVDSVATQRDLGPIAKGRVPVVAVHLAADASFSPAPVGGNGHGRGGGALAATGGRPYVLYLGINKPHKNLMRLVEAWERLPLRMRDAYRLVLAGRPDPRYPEVAEYVRTHCPEDVILLGGVPGDDLVPLYRNATLFVFPSLYEGFGLPVLEAMACGTPVACSDSSSLPQVAGDAALLFNPRSVPEITRAIEHALADPSLRNELSRKAIARAATFTWEAAARATLRVYRQVRNS